MKVKLVNENFRDNYGIKLLQSKGIQDIDKYINPTEECLQNPTDLDNIENGAKLLKTAIEKEWNILLIIDSDNDGFTSSAIMYQYIKKIAPNINIQYRLHEGKQHGLEDHIDWILEHSEDINMVILPDSSSNDFKYHEQLREEGIPCLVLDHHITDNEISSNAIIINNQLSELYSNKALCGVAMVWKFCEEMDSRFGTVHADDYLDLVAIGLIADMMDMRVLETHYLTLCGLDNINNPLLKALIEKQAYSLKDELTRFGISFYVAPLINATIRVGTQEEKKVMFNSMLTWKAYEEVDSTKRGCKGEKEWLVTQAVRNCTNVHGRQRKMRQSGAEVLRAQIEYNKLYENQIMLVEAGDEIDKNLVGLVAMELAATYKKPVLLLKPYEVDGQIVYQGSGRNYDRGGLEDFKHFLNESGMFTYAEGK